MHPLGAQPPRGFTLIELVVTLAMASILAMMAVPSFSEMMARIRLEGMMSTLGSDLQLTRSEALRRGEDVRLLTNNAGTAYVLEAIPASGPVVNLKTVELGPGTALSANVGIRFSPLRSFAVDTGSIDGSAIGAGVTLRSAVSATGMVSICSPGGKFKGYASC